MQRCIATGFVLLALCSLTSAQSGKKSWARLDKSVTHDNFSLTFTYTPPWSDFCQDGEFDCPKEQKCIPMEYVCDGVPDCVSVRDEFDCPGMLHIYLSGILFSCTACIQGTI